MQIGTLEYRGHHISEWASKLTVPALMMQSKENPGSTPEQSMLFFDRLSDRDACIRECWPSRHDGAAREAVLAGDGVHSEGLESTRLLYAPQ